MEGTKENPAFLRKDFATLDLGGKGMENFEYEPLDYSVDSIRLLVLKPSEQRKDQTAVRVKRGDILRCELVHRTFSSKPKYEALSYTWGSPESSMFIQLNGARFPVRENLWNALSCLQSETDERLLWVDAICINQDNLDERNSQVSLMAFIYNRAQTVLVWLGLPPISDSRKSSDMKAIHSNPYWSRVWIAQEIGLARNLNFCQGDSIYSWEEFRDRLGHSRENEPVKALIEHRENRHKEHHRLEVLLETFSKAQCSEIRDKIFGFLGLAHDCQDDGIDVDYAISMFDLYTNVIAFHQKAKPLSLHKTFQTADKLTAECDRSARLMMFSQLVQQVLEGSVAREASLGVQPKNTSQMFRAKGWIAGEILYLGPWYADVVSSFKATKEWKRSFDVHYTDAHHLEELRKQDETYTSRLLELSEETLGRVRGINSTTSFGFRYKPKPITKTRQTQPESDTLIARSRRFLANNLLMGLVPLEAKVGDLVCQFWECDVAVVLRQEKNLDYFHIIGRADVAMGPYWRFHGSVSTMNCEQETFASYSEGMKRRDFAGSMNLHVDIPMLQLLTY